MSTNNNAVRGDLSTLDLIGVFEALGYKVTEVSPGKYWAKCPWSNEHSFIGKSDTVIWEGNGNWPTFFCDHDHCAERNIDDVIDWAESQRPGIIDEFCSGVWTPKGSVNKADYQRREPRDRTTKAEKRKISDEEAVRNTQRVLGDFRVDESDLWHASAIYPGENWRHDSILLFEHLYQPEEFVCICTDYELTTRKDDTVKAVPAGSGITKRADEWIETIRLSGVPESAAGAWIRLNPVTETGSGKAGAHCDSDVTAHRYMLLESDALPIELQLSLFTWLELPIAAIVSSGGKSAHAWVKLDSPGNHDFRAEVDHILGRLAQFRVDQGNKNPSRYGRLPGALREIGAEPPGEQKLLYLNPNPKGAIFP
jgi:hypothetical protein